MTTLYITIDTEYSPGLAVRMGGGGRAENFSRSIACDTDNGAFGIAWQMDVLERHGLKAVFFVDPMPALLWGTEAISDVVGPILARNHDVQLHLHSEWLALAGAANPLKRRTGTNLKEFTLEEQCVLIDYARDTLIAAGAPAPTAFRAGNYGANDDTLRALAQLGMAYDTSHCPGIASSECDISLTAEDRHIQTHCGVIEVPIGCVAARRGGLRHLQLTALSQVELIGALRHADKQGQPAVTLVSHSFEMLSRDRRRANRIVKRRFESFCSELGALSGVRAGTYAENPPQPCTAPVEPLPYSAWRSGGRNLEQALANALYGSK